MHAEALADWLTDRLTSDRGQADYQTLLQGVVRHALGRPLEVLLPQAELVAAIDAHLTPARLADAARFVVREVATRAAAEARADDAPIGRWLDGAAKTALSDLVARPGWVDRQWVEQLFREKAMEAVVSDTLYRALLDFSTIVPRIVQGVLPSGLGRLAKLGGKATGGVGGKLVEEVERRLEQEIKRFLDKGTRKALEGAAAFTADRLDSPETVAARRDLLDFGLGKSAAFHAQPLDAQTLEAIEQVAVAAAESIGAREERSALARDVVAKFYAAHGAAPLAERLRAAGVDPDALPIPEWAAATWPALRGAFEAPEARDFLVGISGEILEVIEKH